MQVTLQINAISQVKVFLAMIENELVETLEFFPPVVFTGITDRKRRSKTDERNKENMAETNIQSG